MRQCAVISYYLPWKSKKAAEQSSYLEITIEQKAFPFTLTKIQTQKHKHLYDTWAHKREELSDPTLKRKNSPTTIETLL